jgi:GTPase
MKSGFVSILGRPNVGKSTLVNALLSKKVSIVTPRAQTTRDTIMGVLNEKDLQIVFIDTPGLFEGKIALDKFMNQEARSSIRQVDAVVYLIDASTEDVSVDEDIIRSLRISSPLIIGINKIDLATAPGVEERLKHFKDVFPTATVIQLSALENYGLKELKTEVIKNFKDGPAFFPTDAITDKDHSFEAREVIREELLHFLNDEIPHQSAVLIDSFTEKDNSAKIKATIFVEKESHVAIVIGKGGQMIKKISMSARRELERMWHEHVTLETIVKFEPNWRSKPGKLREFGYSADERDN